MTHDETLKMHVVEQLEWNPSVDAANIGVKVKDGVVTLEGDVSSYGEKLEAVRVSKAVRGLQGLADELEVVVIPVPGRSDSDIAHAALQALEWDSLVPMNCVRVIVENGNLRLEGEVEWQYQRASAERVVRSMHSIKSLVNAITLKARVSPSDVKARIESALRRTSESEAREITVETYGGRAILRGSVHSFAAREEAEHAAWAAPGITWVEDQITIKPLFATV